MAEEWKESRSPMQSNLLWDGVGALAGARRETTIPEIKGSMMSEKKIVLVVDDDERERQETALVLEQAGFTVVQACDGLDALSELQQQHFDAMVTDFHMPHLNGLELLAQSRITWPDTPVIIVSKAQWDMSEMATAKGAFAWIRKSSSPGVLVRMLALAVGEGVEWDFTHEAQRVGA
jgi:two-component system chemotaxis response regulator CheY